MTYRADIATRNRNATQQEQALPNQVMNHAGGYVFKLDPWQTLDRFLILGTVGGTYYCGQREATQEAVKPIQALLQQDGKRVVDQVIEISDSGRAPKNNPAILVLALALSQGSDEVRSYAVNAVPKVCRIGTHILTLANYLDGLRGWGRVARRAIQAWFRAYDSEQLAYQAVKYKSRNGWSLRDLLRLSHYTAQSPRRRNVLHFIAKGLLPAQSAIDNGEGTGIPVFNRLVGLDPTNVVDRVRDGVLPWEALPTEYLKRADVWSALSERMPYMALVRNLNRLAALGVTKPLAKRSKEIAARVAVPGKRIHPLFLLTAWAQYQQGHGDKGKLEWTPVQDITDALETAYYASFAQVQPTNKRYYLALDVSGSMSNPVAGSAISCAQAAACLASVTHAIEPYTHIAGFCSNSSRNSWAGGNTVMRPISMPKQKSLGTSIKVQAFGGTDCALPMLDAMKQGIEADVFIVYTDNETWAGSVHPFKALQQYRAKTGINAKLIVVGMTATKFSIADPSDPGMLDIVGFDTTLPQAIAEFVR